MWKKHSGEPSSLNVQCTWCTGCGAASHKNESCSGVKRAALANSSWRCCECGAPWSINRQPPTNKNILVGKIIGAQNNAGPAVSMKRCLMCARVVRATTQPLICVGCQRHCNKSFSKLSRAEQVMHLASGSWKFDICNNDKTNNGLVNTGQPHDNAVRRAEVRSRSILKVLYWNANGLKSKMVELEDRTQHTEINMIMIQRSKLCSRDRIPYLPGYSTIRKDREYGRGGELITFIKEDINFTVKSIKLINGSHCSRY